MTVRGNGSSEQGENMRHVKLRPGADVDATALARLIEAACEDTRQRLRAGSLDLGDGTDAKTP